MTTGSGMSMSISEQDATKQNLVIQQLIEGRSNAAGIVTLTANAATTTVLQISCSKSSAVLMFPTTANAAAIVAATYVSTIGNGTFTVTHTNNANADKTFTYVCIG